MCPLHQKSLQTPAKGNGRFPFISSLLKRSEVGLRAYNGVTEPHRVHDAGVISFSKAFHLHKRPCSSVHAHLVSVSTQDEWGNERINKQKWNHTAPWERKNDQAITSVAEREGQREVVGCIYPLLIYFHPSSGSGSGTLPNTDVSARLRGWRWYKAVLNPFTGSQEIWLCKADS